MKMIRSRFNVSYTIESYDGAKWEDEYRFNLLDEAEQELEKMKKSQPNKKFRLIRSEWEVIG